VNKSYFFVIEKRSHICFLSVTLCGPHMAMYSSQRQYFLGMKFTLCVTHLRLILLPHAIRVSSPTPLK
jgi:hypothetical protein